MTREEAEAIANHYAAEAGGYVVFPWVVDAILYAVDLNNLRNAQGELKV